MKFLLAGLSFVALAAQASEARNFTLGAGLSYHLYEALSSTPTAVHGGTVKSVTSSLYRLDCYSISRYTCSLQGSDSMLTSGSYGELILTISDATFSRALYNSLNVTSAAGVKSIRFSDTSLTCTSGANCVVVIRAARPPQPVPQPGPICTTHTEACTYAGYCYFYDYRTGWYSYGYSNACPGVREVNSCNPGYWECRGYY